MGFGYGRTTSHGSKVAHSTDGKRVKTVFENSMVAHIWAQQTQTFGKSGNGNFYFEGPTIYSYGSHFPIATFTGFEHDGKRVVLFTAASHSVSTSGHVRNARSALRGIDSITVIDVPDLKAWNEAQPREYEREDAERLKAAMARVEAVAVEVIARYARSIAHFESAIANPDCSASARGSYTRAVEIDRGECEAFRKAFKVRARLPKDCVAWVAAQTAAEAKAAFAGKVANARQFAERLNASPVGRPTAETQTHQFHYAVADLERLKKRATTARHWLNKGKVAKALRDKVAAFIRDVNAALAEWAEAQTLRFASEKLARARHFASAVATGTYDGMARGIADDAIAARAWKFNDCGVRFYLPHDVEDALATLESAGDDTSALRAWCYRQASIAYANNELVIAEQRDRVPGFGRRKAGASMAEKASKWQAGENVAGFYQESPTLVRRNGDKLETSRSADAPFAHAVAIFIKAQACRHAGTAWRRNGDGARAGHFTLDSIDSNGNIRIGCHSITFEEMQRLAIAEAPQTLKPRFPLPAIVA